MQYVYKYFDEQEKRPYRTLVYPNCLGVFEASNILREEYN